MGSLAWMTGGRQTDDVLVARAYDPTLIDQGYPLLELVDSSHTTVSEQATLDKWANQAVSDGRGSEDVWSFTVKAYPINDRVNPLARRLGRTTWATSARSSSLPYDPATGIGDPYIAEGGTFRRRIVGISGDEQGEDIRIQCAAEVVV
jgi:hypothetical protein